MDCNKTVQECGLVHEKHQKSITLILDNINNEY